MSKAHIRYSTKNVTLTALLCRIAQATARLRGQPKQAADPATTTNSGKLFPVPEKLAFVCPQTVLQVTHRVVVHPLSVLYWTLSHNKLVQKEEKEKEKLSCCCFLSSCLLLTNRICKKSRCSGAFRLLRSSRNVPEHLLFLQMRLSSS